MELNELIAKYSEYRRQILANNLVGFVLGWDSETEAPEGCFAMRSKCAGVLSERNYKYVTDKKVTDMIDELYSRRNEIDDKVLRHEITEGKRNIDNMKKIPMELEIELSELYAVSQQEWGKAKRNNDFNSFLPILEKIFDLTKKEIKYLETDDLKGYNVLLDRYAKGMTTKEYDEFFDCLNEKLVPFVKKITQLKLKGNFDFADKTYPIEKQREFCNYIMDVMCFDKTRGLMKESEHPFTSGFGKNDVRVTVHYYPELFTSSIYSAIHELGHATYEQQSGDNLEGTLSSGCDSLALHESQSRFYENIIGRSKEFWEAHFDKLKSIYPDKLKDVTVDDMYRYVNIAQASLIRTEADELTYPLHIMLRYKIEREIFEQGLSIKELPRRWNELVKEYLGLDVPSDKEGVLQDIHWAMGSIGYFPTYALGSAYSAQIFDAMNCDFDVLGSLKSGTTKQINEWLEGHLHKFGSSMDPKELFHNCVGADFDPMHYINYLINKYSTIYGIKGE